MADKKKPNSAAVFVFWFLIMFAVVLILTDQVWAAMPCVFGGLVIVTLEERRMR